MCEIVVVADDFKGYGGYSRYVGEKGAIIGWKPSPAREDGQIPIIKLDSGEVICDKRIWWNSNPLCPACLHYSYNTCVVDWRRKPRMKCEDCYPIKRD